MIFLRYVVGELSEEEFDVSSSLSEWRYADGDSVETVVEVFSELSFFDGLGHVDICGGNDSDVSLSHFAFSHSYVFACLEHAQQSGLCG